MIPLVAAPLLLAAAIRALPPRTAAPGDTVRCVAAARFLRDTQRMVAVLEPDTLDDWRTKARLAGCRVTAAGATRLGVGREAARFYERLRADGWTRTPDPLDAPNEASLRFRRDGTDCLFNVYEVPRLFTDAEFAVNDAVPLADGEVRYQALVQCVPAMPAAER
ncbi:MAG TPA: hypothetical protein VFV33_04850 [Gemmatimonadaceae bacterium]|nr:hypothetical protein [Gemmatimonadaceae bacterium]